MIHHLSIAVSNPLRVAQVLAELMQGNVFEFSPHPGSYRVVAQDDYGTAIEIYPLGTQMVPGFEDGSQRFAQLSGAGSEFMAMHIALSVPLHQAQIEAIAAREGWRTVLCARPAVEPNQRSAFKVVEFWLENRLMLELLTPVLARKYLAFATNPLRLEQYFPPVEPGPLVQQ